MGVRRFRPFLLLCGIPTPCAASWREAYTTLMQPVRKITEASKECGWDHLPNMPDFATTSSKFESEIVLKHDKCGHKALMMGGWVQSHTADEHVYHEMLVHPVLVAYTLRNGVPPKRVFLGGSGEGSGAREILRWNSVETVVMVDIDYEITRFTAEHVPQLAAGSFESPRLTHIVGDAVAYLRNVTEEDRFDVLIFDFPDAFESEELMNLYKSSLYKQVQAAMHEDAVLVTQSGPCAGVSRSGSRMVCGSVEEYIFENLYRVFEEVDVLQHPMATWKAAANSPSEWSTITMATGKVIPRERAVSPVAEGGGLRTSMMAQAAEDVDEVLKGTVGSGILKYYNGAVHIAAWSKPETYWDRMDLDRHTGDAEYPGQTEDIDAEYREIVAKRQAAAEKAAKKRKRQEEQRERDIPEVFWA